MLNNIINMYGENHKNVKEFKKVCKHYNPIYAEEMYTLLTTIYEIKIKNQGGTEK